MTDTTDTAALNQLKFVADCCIENPDSIYASEFFLLLDEIFGKQGDYSMPVQAVAVSHLIGKLEAEHQRADDAERAGDNARSSRDLHHKVSAGLNERLIKAETEIAALKGDQVPVAEIKFQPSTDKHPCMYWFGKQDRDFPVGTQFFTAPQKPVALPHGYKPYLVRSQTTATRAAMTSGGDWLHRDEVTAAIEAAGGIVKDGE